jgi:hypothetical protein
MTRSRTLLLRVVVTAAMVMVAGCYPYVTRYVYLDGPGVTHRRSHCHDGAPVGVAYEKSGLLFEVSLEPHGLSTSSAPYLKLRAPRDAAISIPDSIARLRFGDDGEGPSAPVHLKATPLDWQGPYVDEMRRDSPLAEYRFVFADLPPIDSRGTLHLPVVFIDGAGVESPVLTFERRRFAGIVPLNC